MSNASVVLTPVNDDNWSLPTWFWGYNDLLWSKDSILIFLTVGGYVIMMRVLESDLIASVKLRIQTCKGFVGKKQKLVFHGKELARNNSRVKDYGVSDGNVLHLVVRLSDLQAITVRTVCGKEFEFRVQRKRDISYVKKKIAKMGELEGFLDLKDQELVCDGEELEDQRLIDDICRSNEAVIHLIVRRSVRVRAEPVEKDFEVSIVASEVDEKESLIQKLKVAAITPLRIEGQIRIEKRYCIVACFYDGCCSDAEKLIKYTAAELKASDKKNVSLLKEIELAMHKKEVHCFMKCIEKTK